MFTLKNRTGTSGRTIACFSRLKEHGFVPNKGCSVPPQKNGTNGIRPLKYNRDLFIYINYLLVSHFISFLRLIACCTKYIENCLNNSHSHNRERKMFLKNGNLNSRSATCYRKLKKIKL